MTYQVIEVREVPKTETVTGIITRRTTTKALTHGGEIAVCVKLDDGRTAWGFGLTQAKAETVAVTNASAVSNKV